MCSLLRRIPALPMVSFKSTHMLSLPPSLVALRCTFLCQSDWQLVKLHWDKQKAGTSWLEKAKLVCLSKGTWPPAALKTLPIIQDSIPNTLYLRDHARGNRQPLRKRILKYQGLAFRVPKAAVPSWTLLPLSRPRSMGIQRGLAEKIPCTHQTCFTFLCLLSGFVWEWHRWCGETGRWDRSVWSCFKQCSKSKGRAGVEHWV